MKIDIANPSIIMLGFGRFDKRFNKFKQDANKKGIVIREVKLFDVQIPINEKYDEAVNFLKPSINPILKKYFDLNKLNVPFFNIPKILKNKFKLEPFNYSIFEKETPSSNLYPYGYLGLTPLFVDTKYETIKNLFENEEEKRNYNKLKTLSSKNYKPLKTPTAKEEYFKKLK